MTCQDYLALYSDYLDEQLEASEAARVRAHVETCSRCARYDRVLRRGLTLVREAPDVPASFDFQDRLQHRIFHVQDDMARGRFAGSGTAVSVAIAGMIALAAWTPLLRAVDAEPRVEAAATPAEPDLPSAGSIVAPDWWYPSVGAGIFSRTSFTYPLGLDASFPGPYSPLIVQPPVRMGAAPTTRLAGLND